MKKNDWILTIAVLIYSFLFYKQGLGINFFIFSAALTGLFIWRDKRVVTNKSFVAAAVGSLLSGACIAYFGNGLSLIANIISLMLMSAFSINPNTSIITSLFFSLYSIVASYVFVILDTVKRSQNKPLQPDKKQNGVKFLLYLIPFIVVMIFFFMYKASNPLFDNFTKKINLDFISIAWMLFTFGGFFLMYGLFCHKHIRVIAVGDESSPNMIPPDALQAHRSIFRLSIDNEKLSGIILLLMLNLLLLTVNILDAQFLWFDGTLPKDLSYSAFVHQGTGMLIFSIIIAILIIMYYFRGALNFYKGSGALKLLGCFWVAQNAFMVISTVYRNNLYINEYSLTYKRIGVYIWLLLALIGLLTTLLKIIKRKSNWFLFRVNGWLFYAVLLSACFVNWDVMLTGINIKSAEQKHKPLDKSYLISLSEKNIPQLLMLNDSIKNKINYEEYDGSFSLSRDYYAPVDYKPALHKKLYDFLDEMQKQDWQSFCHEKSRVISEVSAMKDRITEIDLQNNYLQTLKPLDILTNLKTLNFTGNYLANLNELRLFPELNAVYISSNNIDSIDFLPKMAHLQSLSLSANNIKKLYPLMNVQSLNYLDLSDNKLIDFKTLPSLENLKTLVASNIFINDYSPLLRLRSLKELILSNSIVTNKLDFPVLPQLVQLSLQNNQISGTDSSLFEKLRSYKELTYLNLSDNKLNGFYILTAGFGKKGVPENDQFIPLIPSLRSLDVSRNYCSSLYWLMGYKDLETLYADGNPLINIPSLESLKKLKSLSVEGCNLQNINFLKKMNSLEILSIGNNNFTDYTPLYGLTGLKQLNLGSVSKKQFLELKKALPSTQINGSVFN